MSYKETVTGEKRSGGGGRGRGGINSAVYSRCLLRTNRMNTRYIFFLKCSETGPRAPGAPDSVSVTCVMTPNFPFLMTHVRFLLRKKRSHRVEETTVWGEERGEDKDNENIPGRTGPCE